VSFVCLNLLFHHRSIRWAYFCQHPDFFGLKSEELLSRIKSRRYVICSEHFKTEDFVISEDKRRKLVVGAIPSICASAINNTLGVEISPIGKKVGKARLVGLLSSQAVGNGSDDSDSDFELQDYAAILEEVNKRFEGRITDDTPPLIDFVKCRSQVNSAGTHIPIINSIF
jgi:hypothetical protein